MLNAYANSLWVDFDRIKPEDIPDIPRNDTRWIGEYYHEESLSIGLVYSSVFPGNFAHFQC